MDANKEKINEEIDILEVGANILKYKYFIFIFTALFAIASIVIALTLPIKYKSTALVIESEPVNNSKLGGMAGLVGIDLGGQDANKTAVALQILKSRKFFYDFDNKRNLTPILFISDWDKENDYLTWPVSYNPKNNKWLTGTKPSQYYVYEEVYKKLLVVSQDPVTDIISISFTHASPNISKKIVDWLIEDLNTKLKEDDLYEAEKSLEYLSLELNATASTDIRNLIFSIIKNKLQVKTLANSRKDYRFKTLDPAIAPDMKYSPVRSIICISITLIGFFFSLIISLIYHYIYLYYKKA
jgi:uncharacterized protein involved in exopolysaccharide biosynthesis